MPDALDRSALITSYRRGLLARLRVAGIEPREGSSTTHLVELVVCMDRDREQKSRRLTPVPGM